MSSIKISIATLLVGCGLLCSGCAGKLRVPDLVESATITTGGEPSHITVQHLLIGFSGSVDGKSISRTKVQAEALAMDVFTRAKSGEDFDALVREYTDDSPPGIYHLANFGQRSDTGPSDVADKVFPRNGMVPAFGDVGFPLQVGEIGLALYDVQASPFGFHIVKRLR